MRFNAVPFHGLLHKPTKLTDPLNLIAFYISQPSKPRLSLLSHFPVQKFTGQIPSVRLDLPVEVGMDQ